MTVFTTSLETNNWDSIDISLKNTISFNDQMQIYFISEDVSPGHLVEAGVDVFIITDSASSDINKNIIIPKIELTSNIFDDQIFLKLNDDLSNQSLIVRLLNLQGKVISEMQIKRENKLKTPKDLTSGIYILIFEINNQCIHFEKVLKRP